MEYKVRVPNPGFGANWRSFKNNFVAVQTHVLKSDGITLVATKAGASIKVLVSDPTTQSPTADVLAQQRAAIESCPQQP
jgi:DNA-binding transcriptional MocR family regulator